MQSCEPNYTSKNNKQHLRMSFDSSYWVMRGFYPNLPVMFKIVMVDTSNEKNRSRFYGKVSLIQPTIQKNHNAHVMFNEKLFAQVANDKANNILVGDTQSEPKVLLTQRHPKCMSPKGCTVFNLRVKD
jgi:hypothetical protein